MSPQRYHNCRLGATKGRLAAAHVHGSHCLAGDATPPRHAQRTADKWRFGVAGWNDQAFNVSMSLASKLSLVSFSLVSPRFHFAFVHYHCNFRTQGLNFVVLVTEPTLCGPRGLCLSTSVTGAATVIYWLKRQSWQAG